ncbi:MAG TPA: hypothetical protein VJQ50_21050, partial [Terriglobales bacterium]|nr:hypothetical protein [Terriglobales bacterium]
SLTQSADGRMATVAARIEREENLAHKTKNKRTDLTPTGLLMEGVHVLYRICTISGASAKGVM